MPSPIHSWKAFHSTSLSTKGRLPLIFDVPSLPSLFSLFLRLTPVPWSPSYLSASNTLVHRCQSSIALFLSSSFIVTHLLLRPHQTF
ncbi:uncharacterized protein BDW70DRAFT_142674 [Aspergillus foveolatus]|uniref:uncharacterized protein n=1 Tax=Aspergillus foveolatus TaxID=210207 RepID=UPI003CCCBD7E